MNCSKSKSNEKSNEKSNDRNNDKKNDEHKKYVQNKMDSLIEKMKETK